MNVMQMLRALAVEAHSKIWQNRFKHPNWNTESFDSGGQRTWNTSPVGFLVDKLYEEVGELNQEVSYKTKLDLDKVRKEAGDVVAMAMMIADRVSAWRHEDTPKVVCLCGSTKFKQEFERAGYDEGLKGNAVLTVVGFLHHDKLDLTEEQITRCHKLHLQKIDLADEVLVINVGGYIGETTRSEILYAMQIGKGVRYLEPNDLEDLKTNAWPFPDHPSPN